VLAALATNAQIDSSSIQFAKIPDSTGFGAPDGKLVNKEIGTGGGEIDSEDGRVELIFPEGALTTNTPISIQPTTNLAPNGVGKSYWFEPSGIQFKKPVRIVFHYSDKEAEICPPDWMSLGIQDHKGKWSFIDYESFDSVSKTLTGYIQHFSSASNITDIRLAPDKYRLLVNGKTFIDVIDITRPGETSISPSGYQAGLISRNDPVLWYANRKLWGNDLTGTVTQQTAPVGKEKVVVGEYRAPLIMPQENPVTIWAEIYRRTRKGKVLKKRLSTSILVYDMYKISVIHEIKGDDFGNKDFLGGGELIDSASCLVKVFPAKIEISEFKNYEPKITKEPGMEHSGNLKLNFYTAGMQGSIHLTSENYDYRLSGYPPEVYYRLPRRNIAGFGFQYVGKSTTPVITLPYPSLPMEIEFIANGREQRYDVSIAGQSSHKLIVTPYRAE